MPRYFGSLPEPEHLESGMPLKSFGRCHGSLPSCFTLATVWPQDPETHSPASRRCPSLSGDPQHIRRKKLCSWAIRESTDKTNSANPWLATVRPCRLPQRNLAARMSGPFVEAWLRRENSSQLNFSRSPFMASAVNAKIGIKLITSSVSIASRRLRTHSSAIGAVSSEIRVMSEYLCNSDGVGH